MKRILFVMIDGFGDINFPLNSDSECIEDFFSKIYVPNISKYFLSSMGGYYGILDPVEPGLACGSDTAHLSIFGFKPINFYHGRGAFESIGAGIVLNPGEIAFKCNFAFVDIDSNTVILRRADKDLEYESAELCKFLQHELNKEDSCLKREGISVTIQHATEHRCGIKIKKSNLFLSDNITGTDPLYDNMPLIKCRALNSDDLNSEITSEIVNTTSDLIIKLLSKHYINQNRTQLGKSPVNAILFRGCSRAPNFPNFDSFHKVDWNPLMMARTCIISGIGQSLGFKMIPPPNDKNLSKNYNNILEKDILEFLNNIIINKNCKFAFFHIKDVDEASHEQDYVYKKHLIESIDSIIGLLVDNFKNKFDSDEFRIVVTGDHSTSCRIGEHSCEPVPFLVSEALSYSNPKLSLNDKLYISKSFSSKNIGRFSGESVVEFLKSLVSEEKENKY